MPSQGAMCSSCRPWSASVCFDRAERRASWRWRHPNRSRPAAAEQPESRQRRSASPACRVVDRRRFDTGYERVAWLRFLRLRHGTGLLTGSRCVGPADAQGVTQAWWSASSVRLATQFSTRSRYGSEARRCRCPGASRVHIRHWRVPESGLSRGLSSGGFHLHGACSSGGDHPGQTVACGAGYIRFERSLRDGFDSVACVATGGS